MTQMFEKQGKLRLKKMKLLGKFNTIIKFLIIVKKNIIFLMLLLH